jgi:hypothetical protein
VPKTAILFMQGYREQGDRFYPRPILFARRLALG